MSGIFKIFTPLFWYAPRKQRKPSMAHCGGSWTMSVFSSDLRYLFASNGNFCPQLPLSPLVFLLLPLLLLRSPLRICLCNSSARLKGKNYCHLLYSHQSGFRTLHSVLMCLLKSSDNWYHDFDKGFPSSVQSTLVIVAPLIVILLLLSPYCCFPNLVVVKPL